VCVFVSLSVISCNSNLYTCNEKIEGGQNKKERNRKYGDYFDSRECKNLKRAKLFKLKKSLRYIPVHIASVRSYTRVALNINIFILIAKI